MARKWIVSFVSFVLAFLLPLGCSDKPNPAIDVTFEIKRGGVLLPRNEHVYKEELLRYKTLLVRAYRRNMSRPTLATTNGTNVQSAGGAVRLVCPGVNLYESFVENIGIEERKAEAYTRMFESISSSIVILNEHAPLPYNGSLDPFYSSLKGSQKGQGAFLEAFIVMSFTNSDGEVYESIPEEDIEKCQLQFLEEHEQVIKPQKMFFLPQHSHISGRFPIAKRHSACGKGSHRDGVEANIVLERFRNYHKTSTKWEKESRAEFVEMSSGEMVSQDFWAPVKGILDKIKGLTDPVLIGILAPFKMLFANWMSDRTNEGLNAVLPSEVASTVQDSVQREAQPGMSVGMTVNLGPALAESLPDKIDSAVSADAAAQIAALITGNTVIPLSDMITLSTVSEIATMATKYSANKIAHLTTHNLGNALGRAIPHATVPALVHVVSHNPMQDYYCYYCYQHKTYCQYCSYAPSQLYYASYYTGIYSTYYTNYYSDYVLSFYSDRKKRAGPSEGFV